MARSSGQSAMEFMLTYGWAILVVMVVGIVMWQIGIFNIGGSIPTTSDGFAQLKPMLATCKMSESVFNPTTNGLQCMFTNPLTTGIKITDINITVNGKYCRRMFVSDVSNRLPSSSFIRRTCTDETTGNCDWNGCQEQGGGACGCSNECLIVPAESPFFVTFFSSSGYPFEPCWIIKPGNRYESFIDITYNISMLGETVEKHSTGHIRGMME